MTTAAPGFYRLSNLGVPLHVARLPAHGRPDKPRALFISGCFADIRQNATWVAALQGLFDVILCELPGHGETAPVDDVSVDGFAAVYAALIDANVAPAWKLTVIGESLGGLVGLALARLRPDRIERVILLDPPFTLTRPDLRALLGRAWRNAGAPAYLGRILDAIFGFDPATDRQHRERAMHGLVRGLAVPGIVIAGSTAAMHAPPRPLPSSLLTDDDLAALRRENAALHMPPRIQGAGHCVLMENPRACLRTLGPLLAA